MRDDSRNRDHLRVAHDSTPKRVLAYARVSSIDQGAHGTSLDAQREELVRYCAANGFPKPLIYVETESGAGDKSEVRYQQLALMKNVRERDLVLVAKQDRWSRDTLHYLSSVDEIMRRGGRFISLAERFDASSPEGRFAMTVMASTAELERRRIRERTVGSRQRLRRMGLWVEGRPPLGYVRDDTTRKLVIDPKAAIVIREMFAECTAGSSTREIAAKLQRRHPEIPGLDSTAIGRKLRDCRYLGRNTVQGLPNRKTQKDAEWIDTHEAIVDPLAFRRAQDALTSRREGGAPLHGDALNAGFLLRGIALCGGCGRVLVAHAPGDHNTITHAGYYLCRHRARCGGPCARQDEVDAEVERQVLRRLDAVTKLLARPARAEAEEKTPDFDAQRTRLLRRRENIVDAIAEGTVSRDVARAKLSTAEEQLADIDRAEIDYHAARKRPSVRQRRELLAEMKDVLQCWSRLKLPRRRRVIEVVAEKIVIGNTAAKRWTRGAWALSVDWRSYK